MLLLRVGDPDRLTELERQRRNIAAHLDWLDREIARERGAAERPLPRVQLTDDPPEPVTESLVPAEVVPLFEPAPPPSKVGCWAVFTASLLLITAGIVALIYWRYGT